MFPSQVSSSFQKSHASDAVTLKPIPCQELYCGVPYASRAMCSQRYGLTPSLIIHERIMIQQHKIKCVCKRKQSSSHTHKNVKTQSNPLFVTLQHLLDDNLGFHCTQESSLQ